MSDYDKSIHSNRDALAWAKFFIKTKNENNSIIDERLMHSWFASAMMAMHDSIYNQEIGLLQSRIKELEDAYVILDECYEDQEKTIEKLEKDNKMLRECVEFTIENSGTSSNYNLKCRETLKQLKD